MTNPKPIRITASCVAGLVASLTLMGIIVGFDITWLAYGDPLFPMVWLLVFASGVAAGAFAWVFSASGSATHADLRERVACVECGAMLNSDWRLCPNCCARVPDETPRSAETSA